ncbi:MAG: hypothetical protein Q7K26_02100 [bacterium]|nr:hypothetical protein [bacterium]
MKTSPFNLEASQEVRLKRAEKESLEFEQIMLDKCSLALNEMPIASGKNEANIFAILSKMIRAEFPHVADKLDGASQFYFNRSNAKPMTVEELVCAGLVPGLPRLKTMLVHRLKTLQ